MGNTHSELRETLQRWLIRLCLIGLSINLLMAINIVSGEYHVLGYLDLFFVLVVSVVALVLYIGIDLAKKV